ncbi:uncharacterized protein [Pyrus communis]|uniref:uncharacterized protein n=1 Tax=Pyrus communis TaxID=23211 RepID=UPI0035C0B953
MRWNMWNLLSVMNLKGTDQNNHCCLRRRRPALRGLPSPHEWNCQGIGRDLTIDDLLEQNKLHTPDIVILLETKNRSNHYVYLNRRLGMDSMHAVEPRGIAGGMCIFWRNYVLLVKYANFFLEVGICDGEINENWRLFAIYTSTNDNKRKDQWRMLSNRIKAARNKCLLIGDFNDIIDDLDKERGNYRSVVSMRNFCDFSVGNKLLDLGFMGYPFTWRNRKDEGPIQQRLDHGLATSGWVDVYLEAKIMHEVLEGSDHAMLILATKPSTLIRKRRFIYDEQGERVSRGCETKLESWVYGLACL